MMCRGLVVPSRHERMFDRLGLEGWRIESLDGRDSGDGPAIASGRR